MGNALGSTPSPLTIFRVVAQWQEREVVARVTTGLSAVRFRPTRPDIVLIDIMGDRILVTLPRDKSNGNRICRVDNCHLTHKGNAKPGAGAEIAKRTLH